MKFGFNREQFLFLLTCLISIVGFSQQTAVNTNVLSDYNDALQLFNNKSYAAAQITFSKVSNSAKKSSNLKSDAAYFEAMCAIKLNQTDADKKVLSFVAENPNSNKKNKAFFNVANYYFSNKKAAHALKWFQKVNLELLSKENRKELNFKMGYGLLVAKEYVLAKDRFLPLINDAKFGNDARYYYGFLAYKLEDYGIAASTLKEIADNESYSAEISYYLLDISFKGAKFERSIDVGKKLLPKARKKYKSEITKIIGESYFNLKKYKEAIPYLKQYKGKKGKLNNTDFYMLGYAYYKQKDFENAVSNFNKIIDKKNNVAQNAHYHLAVCYLKLEKKAEALNAFKSASEMDFDLNIKEDAALNYAKLSYQEGNPFRSVAEVLQEYLITYPKSSSYNEINTLLVSSFIHQQDYKGALEFLAKKKSKENNTMILEVSLYRGIQLFNEKKLKESLPFFTISKDSENPEINLKAQYWEAETLYLLENYKDALSKFIILKKFVNVTDDQFLLIDYNIGYSHFKLKKYENAITAFQEFLDLNNINKDVKEDAIVRLGDSFFATRQYVKAIKTYQKLIDEMGSGADYAQYQIGMSYGFTNNNDAKIDALTKVVNDYSVSSLKDDALYQLAITYTGLENNEKAHLAFERLFQKHPKSVFLSKALVRQGLLFYSESENKKALAKFKEVASQFPNSPDAIQAVANARNIYIDTGDLDEYLQWTSTLKFVKVTNSDLDNTTFAVAEKRYLEAKKTKKIILSLVKYITKFPEGIHKLKANFYLAETFFKTQEFEKAAKNYKVIIETGQNDYSEESLNKLAQIYLQKEDFNKAIPILERLEEEAYSIQNILFAQSNLMKGYYETDANDFAIVYAKKLLLKDKLESSLEYDAKIIIARAAFKNEDFITAEEFYDEVEKNALGELKAEALYYNSFFKNQQKEYINSNKVVQKLIANYSAYKYWAVKSYVIMGKNYYGLKDAYQATFVLENVIKNFKQFEDIVTDAQIELDSIKTKEAKTNNSVSPIKKENKN